MDDCKDIPTPLSTNAKISKDELSKKVDQKLYRGLIGSLLYVTASRPDIAYSVGVCARYQADPRESHLTHVKRILRYLKGTQHYGLWYSHDTNLELTGYSDVDWAGCVDDRKSTSGACFYVGNCLVSWSSRKQTTTSLSTAEAEYIAAGSSCTQLLWMKQMMTDFGVNFDKIKILCDNTSAINISKNPVQHSRTKHIDIRHHFIREHVQNNNVSIDYIPTEFQIADIMTKSLSEDKFSFFRHKLGLRDPSTFA
eukprot:TRINITY_DN6690_c0_g1_i1.p1 TRINITY_DN6690_c0_g1~~TRINITY_DN6690_c0_g1_i1.p1  ORF type:complete len:279 (+),score=32.87 TRINITY_DN6690_c0_g1_i1:80-838(+)